MNQRPTVLVVDDDESVRTALKRLLASHDYDVLTAANGADGLRLLASFRVDVILLDERMPVMDGKAFRQRQLANSRLAGIPVILISDRPSIGDCSDMAAVHVPKSDPDSLVQTIGRVCLARTQRRG